MKTMAMLAGMGLLLLLGAVLGHEPPPVELQNRSDIPVEVFSLSVGGEPVASGSLPCGALDRHLVPLRHEGPLWLDVRFADGRQAHFEAGWFNPGQSSASRIAIVSADSVLVHAW
jgi:hypothetical protein